MNKPIYKKWWFWPSTILVIILIWGTILAYSPNSQMEEQYKAKIKSYESDIANLQQENQKLQDSIKIVWASKIIERNEISKTNTTQVSPPSHQYEDWELFAYNMMNQIYKRDESGYIQYPIHYARFDAIESNQQKNEIRRLSKELKISIDRLFEVYLKMYDIKKGVTD
jgi:hypothetical protein